MGITYARKRLSGMQGAIEEQGRAAIEVWDVHSDDPNETLLAIETAPGIAIGQPLTGDGARLAKRIRASYEEGSTYNWTVTIDYESPTESPTNPLDEPADVSLDFDDGREPKYRDVDGNIIANSAGMTLDPPLDQETSDPVLIISRNESDAPVLRAVQYRNAINSDTFAGNPPGTAKIKITATRIVDKVWGTYWRVVYRIAFREDGWISNVIDEGRYTKVDATDTNPAGLQEITEEDGKPVNDPVKLDGNGGVLPPGADTVFLEFKTHNELPFSVFNFEDI